MPGYPVPHHLLEFAKVHINWISDAIQPSSSSVTLFCLQSFPASGSFPMSQLLASGGQSTGASALASVFPKSIQGWSPLRFTSLISLLSKGLSIVFSKITVPNNQFFGEGNGNPLQCSCLENPMDRGAWRGMVHRVAKSWTGLKSFSTQSGYEERTEAGTMTSEVEGFCERRRCGVEL